MADFAALTRLVPVDGVEQLEGLVVALGHEEVDPRAWERYQPVDSWITTAQTDEEMSRAARVDRLLAELGWKRADRLARHPDAAFPVVRERAAFRAHLVQGDAGPTIAVRRHSDGALVAELVVADDPITTLQREGWRVLKQLSDWSGEPWLVAPFDWEEVLARASAGRSASRARADEANQQWQILVKEAVLAGVAGTTVAAASGVSPQRVNQIARRSGP